MGPTASAPTLALPNWKLWTLCALAVFGAFGWLWQRLAHGGADPMAEYAREVRDMQQLILRRGPGSAGSEADLAAAARDPSVVEQGRVVFAQNCVACHGPDGGGLVGPNLTDAFWLHGGGAVDVYRSIFHGHVPSGMPGWGANLGDARVRAVAAYVLALRSHPAAGGRGPQGVLWP